MDACFEVGMCKEICRYPNILFTLRTIKTYKGRWNSWREVRIRKRAVVEARPTRTLKCSMKGTAVRIRWTRTSLQLSADAHRGKYVRAFNVVIAHALEG
ncbi:unnamed protein product [Lota lota]